MHRRGRGDAWGIDRRQLGSMGGEHLDQDVREIVQEMEAVGHLAGRRRPQAGGFRIRLRAIPHDHLDPGMGLQPLRHGRGFPVGEQGQGAPPGEVHQVVVYPSLWVRGGPHVVHVSWL
jgi:hypothetical protein